MGARAKALKALRDGIDPDVAGALPIPNTKAELRDTVYKATGILIPDKKVCADHVAPFDAFAAAYFAESSLVVWEASRGFGGKSVMLAALAFVEAVTYGAAVSLLGGSGAQSKRVHDYMTGEDENLPDKFWQWVSAPKSLLLTEPTKFETKLRNRATIRVLMASQKQVRGPHPQRLRLDECDEMSLEIFDAVLGQPMEARGIVEQTVASSTHQNPDGTMTEIKKRAAQRGWPVYEWCYRENLGFWLTRDMVARKRATITEAMWNTEYELQEPSSASRAIMPEKVDLMFKEELGVFQARPGEELIFEEPVPGGRYVHGADWAKEQDFTVILTFRIDVKPRRLVAYQHVQRRSWPDMVERFDARLIKYRGDAAHDGTGVGDVVDDLLKRDAYPLQLQGKFRSGLFANFIKEIEVGNYVAPKIEFMEAEYRYCKVGDLFGTGHPPDSFVAGACANWLVGRGFVA